MQCKHKHRQPTKNAFNVLHPSQGQFRTPRLTTVKVKRKARRGGCKHVSTHAGKKLKLNTTHRRTKQLCKSGVDAIFSLSQKQEYRLAIVRSYSHGSYAWYGVACSVYVYCTHMPAHHINVCSSRIHACNFFVSCRDAFSPLSLLIQSH